MSEPNTSRPEAGDDAESAGDYSYDMAHEVPEAVRRHSPESTRETSHHHAEHHHAEPPPPDPDGDYSYDLAHEVPPAKE